MNNSQSFQYTYSAKEQEEIKRIRQKYEPTETTEDGMTKLRRLDAAATKKAAVAALTVGVLGALVMGMGMSLIMTNLGEVFGIVGTTVFLVGIPVGLVGAMLACIAYPLYNRVLCKERKKIAPEIIRLTDELMK